jgi:dTDP-4-keto-6-deoxyhexose 4-ketoreductase
MGEAIGAGTTVTVLGASGFVGSWVTAAFSGAGCTVRAAARRPVQLIGGNLEGPVLPVAGDLTAPGAVAEACGDSEVVVITVADTSTTGTWRISDEQAARAVTVGIPAAVRAHVRRRGHRPRVLFAGSVSQPRHGDRAVSVYDALKQEAEDELLQAAHDGDARALSLRLPTVYGPPASTTGQDRGVVSAMARRAAGGDALTLWNDGSPRRDVLFAADAAAAFVAAAEHAEDLTGRAWDIGSGEALPVGDLFAAVAAAVAGATGAPPVPVVRVPPPAAAAGTDHTDTTVDPGPVAARTGWRARTPWAEGLARTVTHVLAAEGGARFLTQVTERGAS